MLFILVYWRWWNACWQFLSCWPLRNDIEVLCTFPFNMQIHFRHFLFVMLLPFSILSGILFVRVIKSRVRQTGKWAGYSRFGFAKWSHVDNGLIKFIMWESDWRNDMDIATDFKIIRIVDVYFPPPFGTPRVWFIFHLKFARDQRIKFLKSKSIFHASFIFTLSHETMVMATCLRWLTKKCVH